MVDSPPERPSSSIELDSEAETPNERWLPHRVDTQQFNYVSLKDFVGELLPQSYVAMFPDIDLVVERLKNDSVLKHGLRWADFPLNCSEFDEPEFVLFARLVKIVAAISKAATAVATNANEANKAPPHLEYVNNGNMTPRSKRGLDASRPDGFFVLKSRPNAASAPSRVRWCDIAVVAEFKNTKSDVAVADNVDKVLWSLHHLMSDEICRDFVYGFTIENTSMKLWYCDRSNIVVSDEFDIHQDYKVFLIFCLSILYASKGELGWDTTIESEEPPKPQDTGQEEERLSRDARASTNPTDPDASEKPTRYIINVHVDEQVTRRFITISPISLRGADRILGRGTRVWKARELVDGKEDSKVVAIKDYWIDDDRDREGQVVESILGAARDEAHRADVKNHIIDILCHGDVYREYINIVRRNGEQPVISKVMVKDSTRDLKEAIRRRDLAFEFDRLKAAQVSASSDKDQVASGDHTSVTPSTYLYPVLGKQRPLPGVRTRNRLVMTQVGKPLHAEDSLLAVFSGLKDACTGLSLIHECGWMHRDVSTGNIILWEGKGVISDFEYARRIPKQGEAALASHTERTGTLHFMPVEVQEGSYNFMPMEDDVALDLSRPDLSDQTRISTASEPSINKRKRSCKSTTADGAEPEETPGRTGPEFLQAVDQTRRVTTSKAVFAYNPAHDFESLLWIAIYFILNRMVVGQPQQQSQDSLTAQTSYARLLFSGDVHARSRVFTNTDFADAIGWLHPRLHRIGVLVNKWIKVQKAVYKKVESGDLNTIVSSEDMLGISQNISPYLQQIVDILRSQDIKMKFLPTKKTMARST